MLKRKPSSCAPCLQLRCNALRGGACKGGRVEKRRLGKGQMLNFCHDRSETERTGGNAEQIILTGTLPREPRVCKVSPPLLITHKFTCHVPTLYPTLPSPFLRTCWQYTCPHAPTTGSSGTSQHTGHCAWGCSTAASSDACTSGGSFLAAATSEALGLAASEGVGGEG